MTLSSGSRQHRKSMLPTPRPSSRIGSRRSTSGDTSRIARRVPSPMLAAPASFISGPAAFPRVPQPAESRTLPPPEFSTRRACSPSRIPSPSVQTSFPTPEQSETSSTATTPPSCAEAGSAEAPYPTPPASVEIKNDRFQEERAKIESFEQHQNTGTRGPRLPTRRRESTTLTSFSRTENSTSGDATSYPVTRKKLAMNSSVSEKENRRPPARTRVVVPATVVVVPPRPSQRTTVTLIPASESSPRPLVIKKKPPHPRTGMESHGKGLQAKSVAVVPAGIKALIGDIDYFAKEWAGMFDELYAGAGRHEGEFAKTSTRIHPIVESETPGAPQEDGLGERISNSEYGRTAGGTRLSPDCEQGREKRAIPLTPSASAGSISTIQSSNTDGETDHFDVSAASLVRWQHRDNTMLKDAPTLADMACQVPVPELPAIISASKPDPPTDATSHRHSQNAALRSAPQPITPRAQRFIPTLPEINQSPIISGPHLVDLTAAVLSNRKDGTTKFLVEPPPTPTHGTTETTRRNASSRPYPPSVPPHLSSSPAPITMSLVSVSIPHTSSPLAHQRSHDSSPQHTARAASDTPAPARSTSLRGLRAIFKRTSAGLMNEQRQRTESLKELIGEPRVLSLGSISISNFRDAGVPSGGAVPAAAGGLIETSSELTRKTTVNW